MMDDLPLPPELPLELQQVEQDLAARPRGEPSQELKRRCLQDLQSELRRQRRECRWAFAAAIAASLLVGLNLSLSASQATDFGFRPDGREESVQEMAAEIERLLPDFAPREAMRQAMLLRAASSVVPCPEVPARRNIRNEIAELVSK